MEHSPTALQENTSGFPGAVCGKFCAENEVVAKLSLDSQMQINLDAKSSKRSESGSLFNILDSINSESGISEQKCKHVPSEPSDYVNTKSKKEILNQNNTDELFLKSNLSSGKSEENGTSDLDSSAGVGKASSGYCTDTSEKEECVVNEKCLPPTSSATADTSSNGSTSRIRRSLRLQSKRASTQASVLPQEDLLPFDMEKLLHLDYKPVTSEERCLRKLIQQLDTSYTKAVVLITRLENMDPSLLKKYLDK